LTTPTAQGLAKYFLNTYIPSS